MDLNGMLAIGAGLAAIGVLGGGIGIGTIARKSSGSYCKTARSEG